MNQEQLTTLIDFYLDNGPPNEGSALVKYASDLRVLLEHILSYVESGNAAVMGHYLSGLKKRPWPAAAESDETQTAPAIYGDVAVVPLRTPPKVLSCAREQEYLEALMRYDWNRKFAAQDLCVSQSRVSQVIRQCWPERLIASRCKIKVAAN